MITSLTPGLLLIVGACVVPFIKGTAKKCWVVALPVLAFWMITQLQPGQTFELSFMSYTINLLRVDAWSKIFGYIFTLSAAVGFIYGWYQEKSTEFVSALFYIGCSLGVVFAGDLISLYMFWELMAVTSVILILARKTKKSKEAGIRYIIVHAFGGLVLLAGIILYIAQTGQIEFTHFTTQNLSTWLILIGFLVNAAAIPLSSWLPDAYPEATVFGGVILSAYTSKTAVYTLLRGFPGWDILIWVGCAMSVYGIIYALLENDMRRILAYSIINQVGFMVCAAGIGTPLALAGACAHAFCHIIYKALLWMSAGAVLHRTGKSKCTELGGLHQSMPLTAIFGTIGALAISAVPLTSGFTSKTIILAAAEAQHLFWAWLILELASAGVFLHAGIKFPYFVFFAKDRGARPKEAPKSMLIAMGILAFLCIYLGCSPEILYNVLPNAEIVKAAMPSTFSAIYTHDITHTVTQLQMLAFSALVFFLFLPLLKRTNTISIDFDWLYRKGAAPTMTIIKSSTTMITNAIYSLVVGLVMTNIIQFAKNGPLRLTQSVLRPLFFMLNLHPSKVTKYNTSIEQAFAKNSVPIGLGAVTTLLLTVVYFVL